MAFGGGANMGGLPVHVITSLWFMVFCTILIMAVAGATYMFGSYSGDIKRNLGYDQSTLNLLSFFKDLGTNVGILSGLINEISPPWVVLAMGGVLNFFGYFMVWLAVTRRISKPKVWQMCLYMWIGANSQSFANTGALVTAVKNFPDCRGVVLGLLKGFLGLSGAIITQLYHAVYDDKSESLILMIGWLPTVVNFAVLGTVRVVNVVRVDQLKIFYRILYMSLGLAGFLMIIIIVQKRVNFTQGEYGITAAITVVLLLLPIFVVLKEELQTWRKKKQALECPSNVEVVTEKSNYEAAYQPATTEPTPKPESVVKTTQVPTTEIQEASCWITVFRPPKRGEDFTILQAMFSVDMLIIFIVTICGLGGALTAIDNLGQIGKSLGYPTKSIGTFVSLVSIWNYLGRVTAGFASEHFLTKYRVPRTLVLTVILFVLCIGHLLIAFGVSNGLYFASVIIGFCFGAQWPLLYAILSELFGLKYYSTLYNVGVAASPVGLYILNVIVTGHIYDKEAKKQLEAMGRVRKDGEDLNCNGVVCFKLSFIIITAVTFFGALVSVILVLRTRKFYRSDIYKKFREEANAAEREMALTRNGSVVPSSQI